MFNHLKNESSPYLQQHVSNPVDWYPYSEIAFEKAKTERKLIFLSIGYSACHWCHVMAHESFENFAISQKLNEQFVSIKVDREERPDIDNIYQKFAQVSGRNGGWPLSVFLTPEGLPFFVGTYFPPSSRYGLIGFSELLDKLVGVYETQPEEVVKSGKEILSILENLEKKNIKSPNNLTSLQNLQQEDHLHSITENFLESMDLTKGGFGNAPKFPNFTSLLFLIRQLGEIIRKNQDDEFIVILTKAIVTSLDRMMYGGLYDQIGGGFHRYSVDGDWTIPHFEKMLYDNAMALRTYSEAYLLFGNEEYKRVVQETIAWLRRDMYVKEGGYIATLDADSDGEEGKYYTWEKSEIEQLLTLEEQTMCFSYFNISEKGNFEHKLNQLTVKNTPLQLQSILNLPLPEILTRIRHLKDNMLSHRNTRTFPHKDYKIITAWNGLLLDGLFAASRIFTESEERFKINGYIEELTRFLTGKVLNSDTGHLFRITNNEEVKIHGNLDDYAYVIQGVLQQYYLTDDENLYRQIEIMINFVMQEFWDNEQHDFYYSPISQSDVPVRTKVEFDMPLPSPIFVMTHNLFHWAAIANKSHLSDITKTLLQENYSRFTNFATATASFFLFYQEFINGGQQIVIFSNHSHRNLDVVWVKRQLSQYFLPQQQIIWASQKKGYNTLIETKRDFQNSSEDSLTTIFICHDHTCSSPISTESGLIEYLKSHFPEKGKKFILNRK